MVFGTQKLFQFVYSDSANSLNMLFLPHAMGIKRLKTIQSDIFHVNSYIFPTKHPVIIMIFGIQNQIQVVYNSFLDFLKILVLPHALSKEIKNSPK